MSTKRPVTFRSGGVVCRGTLHLPAHRTELLPCVVLAHGFGLIRAAVLEDNAARFADAGYAALTFDYRHFGDSDGLPRQLLSIRRQLVDWTAAIACARTLPEVNPAEVILWGTSFGGGHVIHAAARDGEVAAVISQVPFTDGVASIRVSGTRSALQLPLEVGVDLVGSRFGRERRRMPIVGPPGSFAAMTAPDALSGYLRMTEGTDWRNEVHTAPVMGLARYRPVWSAKRVRCPMLVCAASGDTVTPSSGAARAARAAPRGELRAYPFGHFDVYHGAGQAQAIADQIAFLDRTVPSVARRRRHNRQRRINNGGDPRPPAELRDRL